MTKPRRKPSDDDLFWHGISVTQVNRRYLFDVLALVMADMKRNDGRSPPLSFEQFRATVYGHMDALARETNATARYTKIDNRLLKSRMDAFLRAEYSQAQLAIRVLNR